MGDQGLTEGHTHTHVYISVKWWGDQICLLPRLLRLSGEVMHDAVPTLNLVLGATTKNIVFIPTPPLILFFFFFKLTFTPLSDAGGSVSNYCVCKGPSFLGGVSVKSHCYKKNLKLISKASDTSLRCHLTQIKVVLDSSEGHGLVYSN